MTVISASAVKEMAVCALPTIRLALRHTDVMTAYFSALTLANLIQGKQSPPPMEEDYDSPPIEDCKVTLFGNSTSGEDLLLTFKGIPSASPLLHIDSPPIEELNPSLTAKLTS